MSTPGDQVDVGGVIASDTDSEVQTLYSGHTVTPTANFDFPFNGSIVQFINGITAEVEPALLAALAAAGAPYNTP